MVILMSKTSKSRISGKEATYVAMAAGKYSPVQIGAPVDPPQSLEPTQTTPNLPAPIDRERDSDVQRKPPPRVRKPSPNNNQCLAPTADIEGFRARLREAFGNTMSDEFVGVMLAAPRPALVIHVGRPRLWGEQGVECTAAQTARAGLPVIATAISSTGYGRARAKKRAKRHARRFARLEHFSERTTGAGGSR